MQNGRHAIYRRKATAYHEAGQRCWRAAGPNRAHVSILPNRDHLGICEFGKGRRRSENWLEREILIALGASLPKLASPAITRGTAAPATKVCRAARHQRGKPCGSCTPIAREGGTSSPMQVRGSPSNSSRQGAASEEISGRTARHLFERAVRRAAGIGVTEPREAGSTSFSAYFVRAPFLHSSTLAKNLALSNSS